MDERWVGGIIDSTNQRFKIKYFTFTTYKYNYKAAELEEAKATNLEERVTMMTSMRRAA